MMSRNLIPVRPVRWLAISLAIASLFFLVTCGGGGGGGSRNTPSPEDNVTITGVMDDGSGTAPISDAVCRFLDDAGTEQHSDVTDANGAYRLVVSPDMQGSIICNPRSSANLTLSTFSSTRNFAAGSAMDRENVTPATTVVADIIRYEAPADPEARKVELLNDIVTHQDPNLDIVVAMAERLYRAMLGQQIDVAFGDNRHGDGGDGGSDGNGGDSGGASGDAGDGADFSPLPEATCTFVVGNTLTTGEQVYSAALSDFIADGVLNRPDLAAVAEEVNQGADSAQIQNAFSQVFPDGLGQRIATLTDDAGHFNLPIPPNLAGFIRCTPKEREYLVLGAYFPGRGADEIIEGQDVNPAATVFSTDIVPRVDEDRATVQENFRADVGDLEVAVGMDGTGQVTGFSIGTLPEDNNVGLVAFSVATLFNAFNKNGFDVDFPKAIDELRENSGVRASFLETQGVPAERSQDLADMINNAITQAAGVLGTNLATAWSTGRLNVTVMDAAEGSLIEGATLDISNDLSCPNCGSQTDANGQLQLTIGGLDETATEIEVEVSGVEGYETATFTKSIVALATVDLEARLADPQTDTQAPTVGITSPSASPTLTNASSIDLQGTAADDIDVTAVVWSSDRGGSGLCTGTNAWSASGIPLQEGANVITVTARDGADNTATATTTVNYEPRWQLTILGSGSGDGSITDSANGINCTITAGSASGACTFTFTSNTAVTLDLDPTNSVFTGWSGPCSGTGTCSFTMNQDRSVTAVLTRRCSENDVSISPSAASFPEAGGAGSVEVSAPDDCFWSASEDDSWITLTAASGSGDGTVQYQVDPNPGTSMRNEGFISVSGHGHNVTQTWSDFIADWNAADPQEGEIYRVLIVDNLDAGLTVSPYVWCDGGPYCDLSPQTVSDPGAGPISLSYTIYTGTRRIVTLTLQSPTALHASYFYRYTTGSGTIDGDPIESDLVPN